MILIINYGMGNLHSVLKAFEAIGEEAVISNQADDIQKADALVLPGVGAFGKGMENLRQLGLIEVLGQEVMVKKKPLLGICLGMQLLAKESEEFGIHQGLGWIDARIKKFRFGEPLRIPHVGWNSIFIKKENCHLFKNIKKEADFYFVHSYFMECQNKEEVVAECDYGGLFAAAVQRDNIFGLQFHPEKSQNAGLRVLANFTEYIKNKKKC